MTRFRGMNVARTHPTTGSTWLRQQRRAGRDGDLTRPRSARSRRCAALPGLSGLRGFEARDDRSRGAVLCIYTGALGNLSSTQAVTLDDGGLSLPPRANSPLARVVGGRPTRRASSTWRGWRRPPSTPEDLPAARRADGVIDDAADPEAVAAGTPHATVHGGTRRFGRGAGACHLKLQHRARGSPRPEGRRCRRRSHIRAG